MLNISAKEKIYYKCWKALQVFIAIFLSLYFVLRETGDELKIATAIITIASFCCMMFGLFMVLKLFWFRKDSFYQLIIAGTLVAITSTFIGLIVNVFVFKENLAFEGLFFLEPCTLTEAIFLSAALGYWLKLAYQEKEIFKKTLLEETEKRELLALLAAILLKKELDVRVVQTLFLVKICMMMVAHRLAACRYTVRLHQNSWIKTRKNLKKCLITLFKIPKLSWIT